MEESRKKKRGKGGKRGKNRETIPLLEKRQSDDPGDPIGLKNGSGKSHTPAGVVIGIDPGNKGAIVFTNGKDFLEIFPMPVTAEGKETIIHFESVLEILGQGGNHIFIERALPMAMGAKGAFTYGRGFQSILLAVQFSNIPWTLIEPSKWTKDMHQGTHADLKPKARSLIAVRRLFPQFVRKLPVKPRAKVIDDGPVDALLIAAWGLRRLSGTEYIPDFI